MSHLYLHIPFCKQACHYCDFHFSVSQKNRNEVLQAMMKELSLRKNELPGTELQTIYFGGGTPSLLSEEELGFVFEEIAKHFTIAPGAEITLEANPDDLSEKYLTALRRSPVNRLSIGIQSFRDNDLRLMNRAHTAEESVAAVKRAQDTGFDNITIDLIYGLPDLDEKSWRNNLEKAFTLNVQHLSAYCLTVEPRTALAHFVKTGKVQPVNEQAASEQFLLLVQLAKENGFDQYEISNFGKEGFIAQHNSSYWFGEPYLGIGPSAHSYHGNIRRFNVANNASYVKRIAESQPAFEEEILSRKERYNEFVMTRLRTKWGVDTEKLETGFDERFAGHFLSAAEKWLSSGELVRTGNIFTLTEKGKLFADRIAADLFLV